MDQTTDYYYSLLDLHLDGWMRNLKRKQFVLNSIFLLSLIFYIFAIYRGYTHSISAVNDFVIIGTILLLLVFLQNIFRGGEITPGFRYIIIIEFVLVVFGMIWIEIAFADKTNRLGIIGGIGILAFGILLLVFYYYLKKQYSGRSVMNNLLSLFGGFYDNTSSFSSYLFNSYSYERKEQFNLLQQKLGFMHVSDRCLIENTYTNNSLEIDIIKTYDKFGKGKGQYLKQTSHLLFFTITLGKKISSGIQQYFDVSSIDKKNEYIKKEMEKMKFYILYFFIFLVLCSIILVVGFNLSNKEIYTLILMSGIFVGFVFLLLIPFYNYYLKYSTHKLIAQENKKTMPKFFEALQNNVFNNKALFSSENETLYIAYPLQDNYLSVPLRFGVERTKQKIRDDLQLFFGVIEWMENVK